MKASFNILLFLGQQAAVLVLVLAAGTGGPPPAGVTTTTAASVVPPPTTTTDSITPTTIPTSTTTKGISSSIDSTTTSILASTSVIISTTSVIVVPVTTTTTLQQILTTTISSSSSSSSSSSTLKSSSSTQLLQTSLPSSSSSSNNDGSSGGGGSGGGVNVGLIVGMIILGLVCLSGLVGLFVYQRNKKKERDNLFANTGDNSRRPPTSSSKDHLKEGLVGGSSEVEENYLSRTGPMIVGTPMDAYDEYRMAQRQGQLVPGGGGYMAVSNGGNNSDMVHYGGGVSVPVGPQASFQQGQQQNQYMGSSGNEMDMPRIVQVGRPVPPPTTHNPPQPSSLVPILPPPVVKNKQNAITPLPQTNPAFMELSQQFSGFGGKLLKVYSVRVPPTLLESFQNREVELNGSGGEAGAGEFGTSFLFLCANRTCRIGGSGREGGNVNVPLVSCNDPLCGICSILQNGFSPLSQDNGNGVGSGVSCGGGSRMFGDGVYFTMSAGYLIEKEGEGMVYSAPGYHELEDMNDNIGSEGRKTRVVMVGEVLLGSAFFPNQAYSLGGRNDEHSTSFLALEEHGYNSIYAKPDMVPELMVEEFIIQRKDQAIPVYYCLYEM